MSRKQSLDSQVKSGERIVLNGQNGSGKTTLPCLLLGKSGSAKGVHRNNDS